MTVWLPRAPTQRVLWGREADAVAKQTIGNPAIATKVERVLTLSVRRTAPIDQLI
jgi:hypothetical protein